jgi:nitrite reductase/ring-hydroxylating ferredoxin subunit/DMSO/TMAO reductase YedYZ heme-binding membrane subunit
MSTTYRAVDWNPQKKRYDTLLAVAVLLSLASFVAVGAWRRPSLTAETLALRALGTTAFLLLHAILAIGPLCRLDRRFLPLLYNRRHLGVCTATLAVLHGSLALFQFHALGDLPPLVSLLVSDPIPTGALSEFPFQPLGLGALAILVVLAATSHDFWLAQLSAPLWKAIHMAVYPAYGLLVGHVALGVMQSETSPFPALLLGAGMTSLGILHLAAGLRERRRDREAPADEFVFACLVSEIEESSAKIVAVAGERVAIFRNEGRLSALSNVCRHQNGPLGEGRIVDGCVTCPWHGHQYDPASGRAPAPFDERVATHDLRLEGERVFVRSRANAPGTRVEPLPVPATAADPGRDRSEFAIGWTPSLPPGLARFLTPRVIGLVALAPILSGAIAASQRDPVPSHFEFGQEREFIGWISATPVATLSILRPGDAHRAGSVSIIPLVAQGKHGADERISGLDGRHVRLRGTLAHVDGQALIELTDAPIEVIAAASDSRPVARIEFLGRRRLVGEIVDSKCYYGVMNPGTGKVHRACAARCISGGVPASLLVRGPRGARVVLLLVDDEGRGIGREVLDWVGRPVAVEGRVERHGDLLVFAIDPATITALVD